MKIKEVKKKITYWIASEENSITDRATVLAKRKTKRQLAPDQTPRLVLSPKSQVTRIPHTAYDEDLVLIEVALRYLGIV
jgi:hypothetical protein